MKSIIYLYTEIMPYQVNIYRVLSSMGFSLHVFYLDKHIQTPYNPPFIANVNYYQKSKYSKKGLLNFIQDINPCLMVVCGWFDKDYLLVSKKIRSRLRIPVVCPIDTQFLSTPKQILGILVSKFYIKPCFSHMWVPGCRQYEFARLLGYSKKKILFNSLSADNKLFNEVCIESKIKDYPKYFLFVGRYNKVKGLDVLISAWNKIENKKGWKLTLIGNGPLKDEISSNSEVKVLDFMDQRDLVFHAQNSGCFVLPSTYEPWAVVLQEFAAAGLPIICSDACGASTYFVENGYNGYIFESGNPEELQKRMCMIINESEEHLILMSERSRYLSHRVTPEISAMSLLSVLNS